MNTTFDRKKDREEPGTHAGFKGVLGDFFFCHWSTEALTISKSTLYAPNPQNGQAHSNNSSVTGDELFECIRPFCGIGA